MEVSKQLSKVILSTFGEEIARAKGMQLLHAVKDWLNFPKTFRERIVLYSQTLYNIRARKDGTKS